LARRIQRRYTLGYLAALRDAVARSSHNWAMRHGERQIREYLDAPRV
jgi:hypothetical protein